MLGNDASGDAGDATTTGRYPNAIQIMKNGQIAESHENQELRQILFQMLGIHK